MVGCFIRVDERFQPGFAALVTSQHVAVFAFDKTEATETGEVPIKNAGPNEFGGVIGQFDLVVVIAEHRCKPFTRHEPVAVGLAENVPVRSGIG